MLVATYQIRNCQFAFRCDAKWDSLDETGNDQVRFCNECMREVHLCITDEELTMAVRSNLCIAIDPPHRKNSSARRLIGSLRVRPNTSEGS